MNQNVGHLIDQVKGFYVDLSIVGKCWRFFSRVSQDFVVLFYSVLLYSFISFKISLLMNEKWAAESQSGMKPLS